MYVCICIYIYMCLCVYILYCRCIHVLYIMCSYIYTMAVGLSAGPAPQVAEQDWPRRLMGLRSKLEILAVLSTVAVKEVACIVIKSI